MNGPGANGRPRRLSGSGEDVGRGLGRLVVTLLEVVRQVIERQALRRVDAGDLAPDDVERLGRALMQLQATFDELIDHFGVMPNDIFLPLDLDALSRDALARSDRTGRTGPAAPDARPRPTRSSP